jgi:pimeloyl-ACP methyl ester carboxylesterase
MGNVRLYGSKPFDVVVVHGGPGAPGGMRPVACELAKEYGVIEPLQSEDTLEKQVEELHDAIVDSATAPITLVGWSWGGMLSYIVAARYPSCVKKLILVGSAVFDDNYMEEIMPTRMSRLNDTEKATLHHLFEILKSSDDSDKKDAFKVFGALIEKADSYDPIHHEEEAFAFQPEIYNKVWPEAQMFRKEGHLLSLGKEISSPVIAIHGDYDPHPYEGIYKPLSGVVADFRGVVIEKCGHTPWYEKHARERFYMTLHQEIKA